MSTEVETIVKELGLENARIQVGRERIYPPREGLVVSPKAIEQLKAALSSPDAVKCTIKVTEGETTKFWISKGVVNVPFSPHFEEQAQKVMSVITASESEQQQTQTEPKTESLKQHPELKGGNTTTRNELPQEQKDRVLAQESLFIQKELEVSSLSSVSDNLTTQSVAQQHRLDAPPVMQEQMSQPEAGPPALASTIPKEFDFPTDAVNHAAPVQGFAATVQTQLESAQATAISAKENLELAQKNLATFAKYVKHRGFKAWAKDQMPILKNKALEIAELQGTKLKDWAKEQAPVVKDVAIKTAKQVGYEVAVTAEIVGSVAFAVGKVVAQAAVEEGKKLGVKALAKLEEEAQIVDPATLDPALKGLVAMYGKDGSFSGGEVNYRTESGRVNVYQKDGTPIYVDGKVNPEADRCFVDRLSRVAGNLKQVQAAILQPPPVVPQQPKEKAKGFAR